WGGCGEWGVGWEGQEGGGKEKGNQGMGRDILTNFTVQSVLEVTADELDLEAARQRALQQRPELRQARLRQTQAEQDLRAKRAEYIPDLAAEFNTVGFLNFGLFFPTQSSSLGLSLSCD